MIATQTAHGVLDPAAINDGLRELATTDVAGACVSWRRWSAAARLVGQPQLHHVAHAVQEGCIVAAVFDPKRITAEPVPGGMHVTGTNLMTTAVWQSAWFLVQASTNNGSVIVLLPATAVQRAVRPTFLGLTAADNALIDVDVVVDQSHVLIGDPDTIVDLPYAMGLTVGSIAVGAAQAALALLGPAGRRDASGQELIGEVVAQVAAAEALVLETSRHAPEAVWWSKAAKVNGTAAAEAACALVRRQLGAPTYGAAHPLNSIEADVRGLVHQAPGGPGASRWIATHPSNPNHEANLGASR